MTSNWWFRCVFLFLFSLHLGNEFLSAQENSQGITFFEKKIRPVLVEHCYECHSADAKRVRGGLLLDSRAGVRKGGDTGPAVVPGNMEKSLLIAALHHEKIKMPPKGKLPDRVIADFVRWVKMGAPDPRDAKQTAVHKQIDLKSAREFWAFQPPQKQQAPKVRHTRWPRSDIDCFILAKLEAMGLKPNGDAEPLVLLRRVYFDLIGLPPSPEEIAAFAQFVDRDPQTAITKAIDRLLASPQFGQRWGRHWLDVARFGESAGQSRNISYRFAWRYRNWVIDAFNQDMPYDRFIMEQLAGDLLPAASQEQRDRQHIATGFLLMGPKLLNEGNKSLVYRMGVIDDQIDTTFRAFMGLTVGCARCHDHKYDPIPTRDYYALAGIFRSTQNLAGVQSNNNTIDNGLYPLGEGGDKVLVEIAAKSKVFEDLTKEFVQARREKQALEKQLRDLKKKAASKKKLAEFEAKIEEAHQRYRKLAQQRNQARKAIPEPPPSAMAVREHTKIADCELFVRGDVGKPSTKVPRGMLQTLSDVCPPEEIGDKESGRLQLARWISSKNNPLTARVMVNRIWQHLFGAGLVKTVDNFGSLGQRPTHPDLLDYLAVQFMKDGWSIKSMIRRILLSRAYRMSSSHDKKSFGLDPENRLLWRMNRRRLEGEVIRDAMLAVAGHLDTRHVAGSIVSGIGMFEMSPEFQTKLRESFKEVNYRSVYLPVMRAGLPDMLKIFDAPDPSLVVGRREVTTVAPQALFLMNNPFVLEQAKMAAKRIVERYDNDLERVNLAYRLMLSRDPTEKEREEILAFLAESSGANPSAAWTDICHVLMATAEFRTIY